MIDDAIRLSFWANVNKDCWTWKSVPHGGYGSFSYNGQSMTAHRFVWIHILGRAAPEGMELHHTCLNKSCVNPSHLELLTVEEHRQRHSGPKTGTCALYRTLSDEEISEMAKSNFEGIWD